MPRPRKIVPSYRLHRPSNQAVVTISGRDIYLGRYNSPESLAEYARICAELRTAAAPVVARVQHRLTVTELILEFWGYAAEHYRRPDGTPTKEPKEYRQALRFVRDLYGKIPAQEFGPLCLQAVRQKMIEAGWCRTRINKQIGRVRRLFRWAVGQELVPVSVAQGLDCVQGLQAGRTEAHEAPRVEPVDDERVKRTIEHLVPTVRAMVELQRLAGLRPGEVRHLQPADIDRSKPDEWVYRPAHHKMAHLGRVRIAPLGDRARTLLEPWLLNRGAEEYIFSPVQAREERYADMRKHRKSKVPPSQLNRRKPAAKLRRRPQDRYSDHGYAAAIRRACRKAGVEPWHPNQLRHTFASEVRRLYGLEAAQVLLGHARADVTQVYAERDWSLAVKVAREIG